MRLRHKEPDANEDFGKDLLYWVGVGANSRRMGTAREAEGDLQASNDHRAPKTVSGCTFMASINRRLIRRPPRRAVGVRPTRELASANASDRHVERARDLGVRQRRIVQQHRKEHARSVRELFERLHERDVVFVLSRGYPPNLPTPADARGCSLRLELRAAACFR